MSDPLPHIRAAFVLPGPYPEVRPLSPPVPAEFEALTRNLACGLCSSTDLRVIEGRLPFHGAYPAILGHESISEVIQPARHGTWPLGTRVTRGCAVWPGIGREGLHSGWGAMADQLLVRDPGSLTELGIAPDLASEYSSQQQSVPIDIPIPEAVLSISLSEVHSWLGHLGPLQNQRVVILGTGIVGYGMLLFARLSGAKTIVLLGRRESRLAKGRVLGADDGFLSTPDQVSEVRAALQGGADYLLDSSGDPAAFAAWLPVLEPGGTAAAFGIPDCGSYTIPLGSLPQGVRFMAPRPKEVQSLPFVFDLLRQGAIPTAQLITHLWRWPDDLNQAVDAIRRGDVIKSIMIWPEFWN